MGEDEEQQAADAREYLQRLAAEARITLGELRSWFGEDELVEVAFLRRPLPSPVYRHDCDKCEYLGRWGSVGGGLVADLYTCEAAFGRTFIARFSSEPSDYTSGAPLVLVNVSLAEAKRRHEAREDFPGRVGLAVGQVADAPK